MPIDSSEIRVAGSGGVYLAPLDSTFPDFGDDLEADPDFLNLGYITEDGATFTVSRESEDIYSWQSLDPVRTINKRIPKTVKFNLQQTSQLTIALALGGGTWDTTGTTPDFVHTYTPPGVGDVDERAMIVQLVDGDLVYRWLFPRALNKEGIEFNATRNKEIGYPITMSILQPADSAVPYTFQSNDPVMAEAGP
jgi:hypothetical protein